MDYSSPIGHEPFNRMIQIRSIRVNSRSAVDLCIYAISPTYRIIPVFSCPLCISGKQTQQTWDLQQRSSVPSRAAAGSPGGDRSGWKRAPADEIRNDAFLQIGYWISQFEHIGSHRWTSISGCGTIRKDFGKWRVCYLTFSRERLPSSVASIPTSGRGVKRHAAGAFVRARVQSVIALV